MLAKEFKFKKINTAGKNGRTAKNSYYRKWNGFTTYIVADRLLTSYPFKYDFAFEWDTKVDWIERYTMHCNYGVPFISFEPNTYIQLNEEGNERIYTQIDLNLALVDFENELTQLKEIITFLETYSLENLFTNENYYNYFLEKIRNNVNNLKRVANDKEINFCLLHYYYSGHKNKADELLKLLDQVLTEQSKNHRYQTIPRKAVINL